MTVENEVEILKEEIKKLSTMVEKLQKEKNEEIKKSIEEYIPTDLISEIKDLKEKISFEEVKNKLSSKKIIENISEFTKKNPLISLGIALSIGVLIGKALKNENNNK